MLERKRYVGPYRMPWEVAEFVAWPFSKLTAIRYDAIDILTIAMRLSLANCESDSQRRIGGCGATN